VKQHYVGERHRVLLEINNAIITSLSRESLFKAIGQALVDVLPFDRLSLTLFDPTRDILQVNALADTTLSKKYLPVGSGRPLHESPLALVLEKKRPHVRRHLEKEQLIGEETLLLKEGIRAYVAVPLMTKEEPFGSLNLSTRDPEGYSEAEVEFLVEVGLQIGLAVENMLAWEEIERLKSRLEQENLDLQEEIRIHHRSEQIVGESPAIRGVLQQIELVSPTEANVLILGESGTGKELVAREIHKQSQRCKGPMIKVNCACIPGELYESEFFGHIKGAFTGAVKDRLGRFELADGGTLFLDEVGEIPLDLQSKLLRVLQEGQYERVGEEKTREVNVRIIAASNRDLKGAVEKREFRQDLYYRLNVFPIQVSPLRQLKEDIPLLAAHFLKLLCTRMNRPVCRLTQANVLQLQSYEWPGNVRELQNIIERAVITLRSGRLRFDLPREEPSEPASPPASPVVGAIQDPEVVPDAEMKRRERENILAALRQTGWRIRGPKGAAEFLDVKPTTLASRIRKLGLKRPL